MSRTTWGIASDEAARVAAVVTAGLLRRARRELPVDLEPLVCALLTSPDAPARVADLAAASARTGSYWVGVACAEARPDAVTAVTLLAGFGLLRPTSSAHDAWEEVLSEVVDRTGGPRLPELADLLDDAGADGVALLWRSWSSRYGARLARRRPPGETADFLLAHLDVVLGPRPRPGDWHLDDLAVFDALGVLPELPPVAADWLYAAALGTRKTDRPRAQALLDEADPAGSGGRTTRLVAALGGGRAESRQQAAAWLARRPDPGASTALEKAVAREKHDAAKAAMLDALEALGHPVDRYLDPAGLLVEAEQARAEGWPAQVGWLPVEGLPETRWAASGEPVPPVVLMLLVARAARGKTPEPNAILRKYAALLLEPDRHRLARALLDQWLAEDQRRMDSAHQTHNSGHSVQSAVDCKGLLAVVAACAGPDVPPVVEAFVREHYGWRAAQCKALLPMLAWVDQPAAVHVVLSIGTRFRTKGIKDVAYAQVEALADRKGWTVDELADRTVPSAGFDDGDLVLSFGPRVFVGTLLPDLTIRVTGPDGAVVKTLPTPRASDDEDLADAARKALAAARKEVKAVAKAQALRLHAAMCAERTWSADAWQEHVLDHVLVGRLARRLVWLAGPPGGPDPAVTAFRPLDDGTLADVDDEPVLLDPAWEVRLAHDVLLPDDDVGRWVEHLTDYEVAPLFAQLGGGSWTVPDAHRTATELTELEGHVVGHFSLRSAATKRGWTRGEIGDGPSFHSYVQTFPALAIAAHLRFSGSPMPEVDRPRALHGLGFTQLLPDGRGEVPLTLGEVPRVLLAECRHDLLAVAAAGTGYDPDWKTLEF